MRERLTALPVALVATALVLAPAAGLVATAGATAAPNGASNHLGGAPTAQSGGLTVTPSPIDFGTVAVGDTSKVSVTVSNEGSDPITISEVSTDVNTSAFSIEGGVVGSATAVSGNYTLEPGESVSASAVFEPKAAGTYGGTVTVSGPSGVITTEVRAVAIAPDLALEPASLSFADATVGETSRKTVTVYNTGKAPLEVSSTSINGPDSFTGGRQPFTVQPGGSTQVSVSFTPKGTDPVSGSLQLASNDPDEGIAAVYLSPSGIDAEISGNENETDRRMNATVRNVEAGESLTIPVPAEDTSEESAWVENISVTPKRSGSFELSMAASQDPLETSPDFAPGDKTEGVRYMEVQHSIPNSDIEGVSVTTRVRKDVVSDLGSDGEAIALYRYQDGQWVEQETTLVGETDTQFIVQTRADGFSDWLTGVKRADIQVTEARTRVETATVGETVNINVRLTNTGGSEGTFTTRLEVNGSVVETREATVRPGGTARVTFERPFDQPGRYNVTVNGVFAGFVDIDASGQVESGTVTTAGVGGTGGATTAAQVETAGAGSAGGSSTGETSDGDGASGLPVALIAGALVLIIAAAGGLWYVRGRGEETAAATAAGGGAEEDVVEFVDEEDSTGEGES